MNFFRRISNIIIPTVYEDALSYSEMVRKIGGKVNEVVEWINNTKFVNSINGRSGDVILSKLRFTGYSQEEYDGTTNVTVRIPTGVAPNELGTLRVQHADGTRQEYDGSDSITIAAGGVEKVNGKTGIVTLNPADIGALPTSKEQTGIKNPMALRLVKGSTYYDYDGSANVTVTIPTGGGGEGAVTSVNNQTGDVYITPQNIGAQVANTPSVNPYPVNFYDSSVNPPSLIDTYDGSAPKNIFLNQSGSGGITPIPVTSVNGQTGAVQLNADSVGAIPNGYLQTGIKNPNALTINVGGTTSQQYDGSSPVTINLESGGGVSGVTSVNGKTGVVNLTASDVGAVATGGTAVNPNVLNISGYSTAQYDGSQQVNIGIPNKIKVGTPTTQYAYSGAEVCSLPLSQGVYIINLEGGGLINVSSIEGATLLMYNHYSDAHYAAIINVTTLGSPVLNFFPALSANFTATCYPLILGV